MFDRIINVIKFVCQRCLDYLAKDTLTALFLSIFLIAWLVETITKVKCDLDQLKSGYITFKGAALFNHTVDSKWNSPLGANPATKEVTDDTVKEDKRG